VTKRIVFAVGAIIVLTALAALYVEGHETLKTQQRLNAQPPRDMPVLQRAVSQPGSDKVK
jgi:hypothetical protein